MPPRSYRQYCALARALDAVGDRWSLLIVRNLLLGPQRWSELRDGLPGIAKNLLSSRLTALTDAGVVARSGDTYELTPRGAELERPVFALADWGERHRFGPPVEGEAIRARYLMTSIRRRLRPSPTAATLEVEIDGVPYAVTLGDAPTVVQGRTGDRHAVQCSFDGIRGLLFERRPVRELVERGRLAVRGDIGVIEAFVSAL